MAKKKVEHKQSPNADLTQWSTTQRTSDEAVAMFDAAFIAAKADDEAYNAAFKACVDDHAVLATDIKATTEAEVERETKAMDKQAKVKEEIRVRDERPFGAPPNARNRLAAYKKELDDKRAKLAEAERLKTAVNPSTVHKPHTGSTSKSKSRPKPRATKRAAAEEEEGEGSTSAAAATKKVRVAKKTGSD